MPEPACSPALVFSFFCFFVVLHEAVTQWMNAKSSLARLALDIFLLVHCFMIFFIVILCLTKL